MRRNQYPFITRFGGFFAFGPRLRTDNWDRDEQPWARVMLMSGFGIDEASLLEQFAQRL